MENDEDRITILRRMIKQTYLTLSEDEEVQLAREVSGLLDNVDILAALEVEEGPPLPPVEPAELRPDETIPSLPQEDALSNAPDAHDGFVAVPKILGADSTGDDK